MDLGGALNVETWLFAPRTSQTWATLGENYALVFPGVRCCKLDCNRTFGRGDRLRRLAELPYSRTCSAVSGSPRRIAFCSR